MTLTSLWRDRHPRAATPPDGLDGHVDVVVVGAGLTGITTALQLAKAGLGVTVVEAGSLGGGTTGSSTAKISLLQGTRLSSISRQHPLSVVSQYVEGNKEAQAWLRRFADDHGVDVQERDAVTYATTSRGEDLVASELDVAQQVGLPAVADEDPPLPFPTTSAVRLPGQLQVDPLELLEALAREAAAHGVRLVEGVRVLSVRGRSPVEVRTGIGSLTADTVVLATGMPILDRGAFFARMTPARSYGLAFSTPAPEVDAMYLSADQPSRSLRDAPGPLLLVGGAGHTTGRVGSTTARLDELREWTAEWYPDATETHAWSAQDYVPSRALPFAGPVLPGAEHLLVAGGYAKWGMTNGVAAALALTAQVTGGQMPWAEMMWPWAAGRELRGLPQAARANAEVGFEMGRGWLRPLVPGSQRGPDDDAGLAYDGVRPPTAQVTLDGGEQRVAGVCTHLGGVVRWNDAERSWDCPLHGSRFAPDGEVLEGPATCGLRRR